MFRPSRERRGPDPQLGLKMALFAAGAVVGVIGMALENRLVVTSAVVILGVAIAMRFTSRRRSDGEEVDDGRS